LCGRGDAAGWAAIGQAWDSKQLPGFRGDRLSRAHWVGWFWWAGFGCELPEFGIGHRGKRAD
jgi:hypothetical protein